MKKYLWAFALVSLLCLGMLPVASATYEYYPTEEYIVKGTRTYGIFPDDIEKIDNPYITYRTENGAASDLDVRMNFTDAIEYPYVYQLRIRFKSFDFSVALTCNPCFSVQVYDGSSWSQRITSLLNASWKEIRYTLTPDEAKVIGGPQIKFLWNDATAGPYELHLDRVTLVDYIQELYDRVDDLEDRVDDLERRIKELEKQIHSDNPVVVNETNLPCIPRDSRGTLEYDTLFIDPYLVTVYDLLTFKSGSDLDFYLIYPSTSDEVTVIEDWIHIEETSYTRLWVNDTVAPSELLNTTDAVGPFNLEYGYNITVQTSGASSSVRADRTSTVRLIDAFNWGESTQTGIFATTSKIENDLGFEDMSNVLIRWAFPTEDSENRDVDIDMSSVQVWDHDNNLELDRGRHYSLDESSVIMELRWLNVSESRSFRIQFERERDVETEEYFVVRDNDISISDQYGNAPFTTNIHFTASGRAFFEGKIIIRFDLSGRYAGEHLDVRSLIIKRSDSSLSQQYTYDSISNELRITDQSVGAGESITYTLYFDWYDEKSAVYELILGDPLVLYSLLLLAGFAGLFIFLDATKEEKRRKYAGMIIIGIDVVILVVVLVAGAG